MLILQFYVYAGLFSCIFSVTKAQDEVAECFGDAQFTFVEAFVVFDTALSQCRSRSATLARISNAAEHAFVVDFFNRSGVTSDVWIGNYDWRVLYVKPNNLLTLGVFDPDDSGILNPERFQFVDGNIEERNFFLTFSQFPWGSNQPNNNNGNQNCVE